MRSGLERLVNPASRVSDVDVAGTAEQRRALHDAFRLRQHLIALLATEGIDSPSLVIEVDEP